MKKFIISIDQGTTSTRIVLFNLRFQVIDIAQEEIKQYFPNEGWVEHNPIEIINGVKKLLKKIIIKNKIKNNQVLSIGITNQRETCLLWNKKTGKPIYNAIVWQDKRTAKYCEFLKKNNFSKKIRKITGLIIDPYFSATKINWLLKKIKISKKLIKNGNLLFGTIDTWLLWNLTNKKSHFTDITNASRTMIFDIRKEIWSKEILSKFNIPASILPEIKPNVYKFGTTNICGLKIPIGGMIGDQQSATIGQSCFKKGESKITFGTGCFLITNIGDKFKLSKNNLLTSITYKIGDKKMFCFEGGIFVAGSAIQWLRDKLKLFKKSSEVENLAKKRNLNEKVIFIPTLTGIGAPYWNPYIRGAIFEITRNTKIQDIVYSALESISFLTFDLLKCVEKDLQKKISIIKIDGGMAKNNYFNQILSNILFKNIIKPKNTETSSLGAAYLAGINCGIITDTNSLDKKISSKIIFSPNIDKGLNKSKIKKWKKYINKLITDF